MTQLFLESVHANVVVTQSYRASNRVMITTVREHIVQLHIKSFGCKDFEFQMGMSLSGTSYMFSKGGSILCYMPKCTSVKC